jgi:hypothetical protein
MDGAGVLETLTNPVKAADKPEGKDQITRSTVQHNQLQTNCHQKVRSKRPRL